MITQVTSANKQAYDDLFYEATQLLKNRPNFNTPITSLEEYFVWLPELAKLSNASEQYGLKYTILPLDEGYFYIDANTRKIDIPSSFKKNGIAVQGDHGAETVYFKIARYFDYQDLNDCEIYIQWKEMTNSNGTSNGGVMKSIVRDIESDRDNLIFGWPLLSNITENSGTISFSVRFIKTSTNKETNQKQLDYSFSTLDAIATINPALDEDWETMEQEASLFDSQYRDLIDRLMPAKRTGDDAPAVPYYTVMLIDSDDQFNVGATSIIDEFNESNNYTYTTDLLGEYGSAKLYFAVEADRDDIGKLSYTWLRNNNTYEGNTSAYYQTVTGTENPAERVYYIKNDKEEMIPLTNIDATDSWQDVRTEHELSENTPIYYQTYAILEIVEPGKYQSKVTNTNSMGNGMVSGVSNTLDIPKPTKPRIKNDENQSLTIEPGNSTLLEVDLVSLAENDTTIFEYNWNNITTESVLIENANQPSLEVDQQGVYQCSIVGKRNNDTTDIETSGKYFVSYPALKVTITGILDTITGYTAGYKTGNELQVNYILNNDYTQLPQFNPAISYQWFNGPDGINPIEGATEQTYIYSTPGNYSVRVYNTYNNDQTYATVNFSVVANN